MTEPDSHSEEKENAFRSLVDVTRLALEYSDNREDAQKIMQNFAVAGMQLCDPECMNLTAEGKLEKMIDQEVSKIMVNINRADGSRGIEYKAGEYFKNDDASMSKIVEKISKQFPRTTYEDTKITIRW